MGGAVSAGVDNDDLVDNLKAANYIRSPLLERVFRAVDRGDYFTSETREQAYRDNAWKKGNLHLSAPCIYAKVMEGLDLAPGHAFLNLGSGTGYLSTMAGLIIGPYGVNHGVELHADVVDYGQNRLEEFKRKSPAIDAFQFCDPQFVHGNCLCLPPDMRLYDRVYCGASCPETHETYMKVLIKEGGVLVMPINDQLVKMTRTGPNSWETQSLLPVTFSSLVLPDSKHPPATVTLPSVDLMGLQEMCRHEVRSILRSNIDKEHPALATAGNRQVQTKQKPRGKPLRSILVPYVPVPFYESDDDTGLISNDDADDHDDIDGPFDSQHTAHQISAVIELARSLAGQRRLEREREEAEALQSQRDERDDVDDIEEEEKQEEGIAKASSTNSSDCDDRVTEKETCRSRKRMAILKKMKSNGEMEEKVEECKGDEKATASVSAMPQSDTIPMTSTPLMPVKSSKKREKFDSGVGDEIENGKGPSSESEQEEEDIDMDIDSTDSDYSDNSPPRMKVTRILDSDDPDCQSDEEGSGQWKHRKEDGEKSDGGDEPESPSEASPTETYSTHMREKIRLLPLPQALKMYLNYNREL